MIPGVMIQVRNHIEMMLASEDTANVVTAKLHWRVVTGRDPAAHPDDESAAADLTVADEELEFRAFFHTVQPRASGFQRFVEVQTGDVMLDYLVDLELDGKEDLRVEIAGKFYVQKTASKELLETWDVLGDGNGLLKTLLLAPAK